MLFVCSDQTLFPHRKANAPLKLSRPSYIKRNLMNVKRSPHANTFHVFGHITFNRIESHMLLTITETNRDIDTALSKCHAWYCVQDMVFPVQLLVTLPVRKC